MELEPRKKKPDVNNLKVMSIEALEEYIGELHAEIERIRAGIAGKEATPRPFSANNPPQRSPKRAENEKKYPGIPRFSGEKQKK